MERLSVVFPVWNEGENLPVLYERVREACQEAAVTYEMIFVDNGSTDGSLDVIKSIAQRDRGVRYVSLSRNFGHQGALFAGMSHATGQAVMTMDADLQHPPGLLPEMVALWRSGIEVVYTTKRNASLPWLKSLIVKLFYRLISTMSGIELDFGLSDFRLLDRKVAEVILDIPEYHKFLRGQVKWVGFKQQGLSYNVEPRLSGRSKFSYRNLFAFALDGLFAFSRYPLRLVTAVGCLVAAASLFYMAYVFCWGMVNLMAVVPRRQLPPGWATLAMAILFLGSTQLVAIGIVGEYIGRVYDQTKGRPVFIVREASKVADREAEARDPVRGAGESFAALDG